MPPLQLPTLTHASAPLIRQVQVVNEFGEATEIAIPAERDLTVYVDKRELVTLMTLGAHPELLVLGYLRNQRLVRTVQDIESISVDWEVGAASVKTRQGIDAIEERTAKRVVTTGCGQGSVFGGLMDEVDQISLPDDARLRQSQLYAVVNAIRLQESTYKTAGSVHGCALFRGEEKLIFVEDVGRHNAVDTIAGWMWLQNDASTLGTDVSSLPPEGGLGPEGDVSALTPSSYQPMSGADKVFYTTGRLTSEMVIKAAQMGVPVVVSRSGITQMGLQVAQKVGLCAIGRATHQRFLCYTYPQRLVWDTEVRRPPV